MLHGFMVPFMVMHRLCRPPRWHPPLSGLALMFYLGRSLS